MSPNTNPVANEYDVVPVEGLPEGLPGMEQPAEQPVEQHVESNKNQKKDKNLLRRLCGLLLVVL